MCSLDSLLQRMGRVYRKRKYQSNKPNVYILNNKNGVPYIIDEEIYRYTLEEIKEHDGEMLSENVKQEMINHVFSIEENRELKESKYYKKIKETINLLNDIRPNQIPKKEIDQKFRDIQNISLMPDTIFDKLDNEGKIDKWKQILTSKKSSVGEKVQVKDEIRKYVVNVRYNSKLSKDKEELFYKGSNIYRTNYVYEFDKRDRKGRGLIMRNMGKVGYFDE